MAGSTRLELATSGVTGRRSNQLNYDPAKTGFSDVRRRALFGFVAVLALLAIRCWMRI